MVFRSGNIIVVDLATTADRALSGLAAIDGKTPSADMIVLVAAQTDKKQNGLYLAASGSWTRLLNAAGNDAIKPGVLVSVREGDTLGDGVFLLKTDAFVIGTDDIEFTRFDAAAALANVLAVLALTTTGNGAAKIGVEAIVHGVGATVQAQLANLVGRVYALEHP